MRSVVRTVGFSAAAAVALTAGACDRIIEPPPPEPPLVAVAAGAEHSCAVDEDGRAFCWGRNTEGQLGSGDFTDRRVPTEVLGSLRFTAITAGESHTCGIDVEGAAYCWGWNAYFQRGNSSEPDGTRPVRVSGGHVFSSIDAGQHHTCGITTDSRALCWGFNGFGQLGDGTKNTSVEPIPVSGGLAFREVSAGASHSCGLTLSGEVHCWGLNTQAQLGTAADAPLSTLPLRVSGSAYGAVTAGYNHSCAIASGVAFCWGGNEHGQIGDGTAYREGLPGAFTPTRVKMSLPYRYISAGRHSTCAVTDDGHAHCWGEGEAGKLGNGNIVDHYLPQPVHLQPERLHTGDRLQFETVHVGRDHTCGLTIDRSAYCWGAGAYGQLGNRNVRASALPVRTSLAP